MTCLGGVVGVWNVGVRGSVARMLRSVHVEGGRKGRMLLAIDYLV